MNVSPRAQAFAFSAATVLVLAGGGLLVCPDEQCRLLPGDAAVLTAFHAIQSAWLDNAFLLLTWGGSLVVLLPLTALVARHDYRCCGASWRVAAFLPLAVSGAALLAHLAKLAVARPRPDLFPALTAMPADASFPSAHSMQVAAFATAFLLRPAGQTRVSTVAGLFALVAVVAVSRVYLQVHFPSDVMFGLLAAVLWVLALRQLPPWREAFR
jgi:undecaprenyl-diphosphatase